MASGSVYGKLESLQPAYTVLSRKRRRIGGEMTRFLPGPHPIYLVARTASIACPAPSFVKRSPMVQPRWLAIAFRSSGALAIRMEEPASLNMETAFQLSPIAMICVEEIL